MLVWGSSKEDHDKNPRKVLGRSREVGINWSAEKCFFGATQVSYFGHIVSDKVVQPDPNKVAAIHEKEPQKTDTKSRPYSGW
mgnify:FL=1